MGKCLLGDKQTTCISHSQTLQLNLHYVNLKKRIIQHHLLDKMRPFLTENFQ